MQDPWTFEEYMRRAFTYKLGTQTRGAALYNVLAMVRSDIAPRVSCTTIDPSLVPDCCGAEDTRIKDFLDYVEACW